MDSSDIAELEGVVSICASFVDRSIRNFKEHLSLDNDQAIAYDLAHIASSVQAANSALNYARKGSLHLRLTQAYVGDVAHQIVSSSLGREYVFAIDAY